MKSALRYFGPTVVQRAVISVQNVKGLPSREPECTKFDITVEVPKEKSLIYQMHENVLL